LLGAVKHLAATFVAAIQLVELPAESFEGVRLRIFEAGLLLLESLAPLSKLRQELLGVLLACAFHLHGVCTLAGFLLKTIDRSAGRGEGCLASRQRSGLGCAFRIAYLALAPRIVQHNVLSAKPIA